MSTLLSFVGGLPWDTLVRYIPEIILVVIFMYYEHRRQQIHEDAETKRAETREANENARTASWQSFLNEERVERRRMFDAFTTQLSKLTSGLGKTNAILTDHDHWSRQNGHAPQENHDQDADPANPSD